MLSCFNPRWLTIYRILLSHVFPWVLLCRSILAFVIVNFANIAFQHLSVKLLNMLLICHVIDIWRFRHSQVKITVSIFRKTRVWTIEYICRETSLQNPILHYLYNIYGSKYVRNVQCCYHTLLECSHLNFSGDIAFKLYDQYCIT